MLSSVLSSERTVKVNIAIMRAFVKLRQTLETNRVLARKFEELEQRVGGMSLLGIGFILSFPVSLLAIAGFYRSLQPATV